MSGLVPDLVAVLALFVNGLVAGLFFAFVVAVSPGLRRVDDGAFTGAFRAINAAILRPSFLVVFAAAPASAALLAVLHVVDGSSASTWAVGAAAASVATFVITAARNVPLNEALARADVSGPTSASAARRAFESPWTRWNTVRTLTSTGAVLGLAASAVAAA
ncbi:DUF1772 domain-containing protein [Frigoribacterium sp. PvP032]|uniref:anthrone oxygenase family protein n=1 Tax=Frigoribacterium sp. PvP032 TaxID=2806589 RepID=UPI001AE80771|nr:anthrone oxygenase family protein [Frigoribacterium sp. PvP032]MBP1189062.1 putative membrane protein [Frigoribacterium sp. PvP032]